MEFDFHVDIQNEWVVVSLPVFITGSGRGRSLAKMQSNTRRVSPSASGNLRPHWTSWGALAAFGLLKLYCYIALSQVESLYAIHPSSCRIVTLLGNEVLLFQRSSLFEETGVVQNAAQKWA